MPVAAVTLDWFRVVLTDGELLTPSVAHAQSTGEPEPLSVTRHLASCDNDHCGWKGNPAEDEADAQAQLDEHVNRAHVIEIVSSDGGVIVDEEIASDGGEV